MTSPPNVLWIMADQLRFDYLSCYGHSKLYTPNIDALAMRGVQFNNVTFTLQFVGRRACLLIQVDM